jgi:glycosyltransferase involved in cell wall biosynthesis
MNPISVCIITQNEEHHLEECLKRIRPYDWEIVVVDTGSTDRSKEIAHQYADKVCDFTWCNDFAAARNFSISQADRPFILVLDSDEYLTEINMKNVLSLIQQYPKAIGRIHLSSHIEGNQTDALMDGMMGRLFPKQLYRYEYPIHEQIVLRTDPSNHFHQIYDTPIYAEHYGYQLSQADKEAKVKRNNDILLAWLERDQNNAYILFQIGQCFFMLDEFEKAYPYYKRSFELQNDRNIEYVRSLLVAYGTTLINTGRLDEAKQLLTFIHSENYQDDADFCCICGSIYLRTNQLLAAMGEFVRALYAKRSVNRDATHNIPLYNIGVINERMGDFKEALVNYKMCVNFPMADSRIRLLEHQS